MMVICLAISSGSKSKMLSTRDELVGNCKRDITYTSTEHHISSEHQRYYVYELENKYLVISAMS